MSVCSLVMEVRIDKFAGAHLVASNRPPRPVSRIRNFGFISAVTIIVAKKVVSKKVGFIDKSSAASFTCLIALSNSLLEIGRPSNLILSSTRHKWGDENNTFETLFNVKLAAIREHNVPLPLLPAT